MLFLRFSQIFHVLVLFAFMHFRNSNAFPSTINERDMISAANPPRLDDEFDIPLQMNQTSFAPGTGMKLIPLPHVLCTGFSISGLLEKCFPVGCICAKGAGICNLGNKCIRTSSSPFFNITFNKDLTEAKPEHA